MTDQQFMQLAIQLARQGFGKVNPNPLVGAVIVKNGRIIGQGCHTGFGESHAEANAFAALSEPADGAVLYVNLEPCCHHGKNPPCTQAIIKHGIKKVVIGSRDPNPLVAGKGIEVLRRHGIEVVEGIEADACSTLNEVFFHFIKTKTPFVTMKYAMTMDGKLATQSGHSRWISGEAARQQVHHMRHRYAAVMIGTGTALSDNPQLTCRLPEGRNPIRILCDSQLRTPLTTGLIATAAEIPTILATCCNDPLRQAEYTRRGCRILLTPPRRNRVDLPFLIQELGKLNIDSVFLEGGGELNWSALEQGVVNKVQVYLSPKLFGGAAAKNPVSGIGVEFPDQAFALTKPAITWFGNDLLLESEVCRCSPESSKKSE